MSFFENTRKPVGLRRKLMVAMMNLGHSPCGALGASISECCAGCQGAGLRLRWRCEHEKVAEKMPAGCREGHRLFARQRGEDEKVNETAIAEGRAVLQGSVADMILQMTGLMRSRPLKRSISGRICRSASGRFTGC